MAFSLELLLGLLLQGTAVAVVLRRAGRRWLSCSGALFVSVSLVYHGVSEIVQRAFPGHNDYRQLVSTSDVDAWIPIVGLAMLAFAVSYHLSLPRLPRFRPSPGLSRRFAELLPDWRPLALLSLPLFWVLVSGADSGYWVGGLATYLTSVLVFFASLQFVLRWGPASVVPVIVVQAVAFALTGARNAVVLNAVLLVSAVGRLGVSVRLRRLVVLALVGLCLVVLISASRAVGGRLDQQGEAQNLWSRVGWLTSGVFAAGSSVAGRIVEDFVYRFDGNAFGALVTNRIQAGVVPPGTDSFWHNFGLMVPSFLNPNKLEADVTQLYDEDYAVRFYNLPTGVDYLPGTLGILYTYRGFPGLLVAAVALGWIHARVDRRAIRSATVPSLLVSHGFCWSALLMEQGVLAYFMVFRTLLAFWLVVVGIHAGRLIGRQLLRRASRSRSAQRATHGSAAMLTSHV